MHSVWRPHEFESGRKVGRCPSQNIGIFCRVPPLFWLYIYVFVSIFARERDICPLPPAPLKLRPYGAIQICLLLLLLLFRPVYCLPRGAPCPAVCKKWEHVPPCPLVPALLYAHSSRDEANMWFAPKPSFISDCWRQSQLMLIHRRRKQLL